jgi:hypothetical protein
MRSMWMGLTATVISLAACAAMQFASPEEEARAKALVPDAQHGLLYIYRGSGGANPTASALVYVRPLAPIGTPAPPEAKRLGLQESSYWVVEVSSGTIRLTAVATLSGPGGNDTGSYHTTVEVKGGQKMYIEVRTNPALPVPAKRTDQSIFVRSAAEGMDALDHGRLIGILRFPPISEAGKG